MSEKETSNSAPDSPEESGEPVDQSVEPLPDTDAPTLPDESRGGDPPTPANCPSCGAEIPPEAPRGLCPKCVLAGAAIPTDVDSRGGRSRSGPRFEPPEIETIAAAFPKLEIVELIGCGGMGAVYKARQPHLDRFVALKILPPSLAETPGFTERFTREGRLLARLSHPAIVGVHDFGQAGGFFYLLMEYVDGVNLRQAMRAGRFTPEQAIEIVPKVCEALQFAHDEGVLHRDIKPENILLDSRGAVKIADFGIAKLLDEAAEADPTLTGSMAPGTPHYMAPEQIEQPATVDHRADIYSLGVVFYEMLTGELPIGRFAAPSEKSAVDSQIDEIVFRSLEKERDRRQQSAGEVKTEIEGIPVKALAAERHPGYSIPAGANSAGRPVAGRSAGGRKAAVLVLAGLLLPMILSFILALVIAAERSAAQQQMVRSEMARTEAEMQFARARSEVSQLERVLEDLTDPSSHRDEIQRQLEAKRLEMDRYAKDSQTLGSRRTSATVVVSRSWFWLPLGAASLLGILFLCIAIPGTLMGWKSLRRIRALKLLDGRIAPMFAALFFPLLLMGGLVFSLIALPMSFGPKWVSALGVSLSMVASGAIAFWVIRAVRRWLETSPPETERDSILADFERSRNPWKARLIGLAILLLVLPIGLFVLYLTVGTSGGGGFVPGAVELIIVAGIVGFFAFLFWRLVRGPRSVSVSAPETQPKGTENPWPRRVFWLLILIFVVPVLLIVVALLLPWLAYDGNHGKSHSVRVAAQVENEHSVTVRLDSRRYTDRNVNVGVIFEGPKTGGNLTNDHSRIYPGQGQEWNLFGDTRQRSDTVTFSLPDRETTELVSREIAKVIQKQKQANRFDESRIELFNVMGGKSEPWRAWIEIRAGTVVEAGSPPVEELLIGSWRTEAESQNEEPIAETVLTFEPDRQWSRCILLEGLAVTSGGVWKLRGGGRLELKVDTSSTEAEVGTSEHVTIEKIDESILILQGNPDDDPKESISYRRVELPAEAGIEAIP